MAYETRGNRTYYYKKVREGNKVKSVYLGNSLAAQREAYLQEKKRKFREDRLAWLQLELAVEICKIIIDAEIRALGWVQRRGSWYPANMKRPANHPSTAAAIALADIRAERLAIQDARTRYG